MRVLFRVRLYVVFGATGTVESGGKLILERGVKLRGCRIYVQSGATLRVEMSTKITDASIYLLSPGAQLSVGSECRISECLLTVRSGSLTLKNNCILEKGRSPSIPAYDIYGDASIGSHNRLRCSVLVRFRGCLTIGSRNVINEGGEIRCDESVDIGDYNQISYDCSIWDTNTHVIYDSETRRKMTDEQYPNFGFEVEKPRTRPVTIGSDCWIGKRASILKGCSISDKCILGYGVTLVGYSASCNTTIVDQTTLRVITNNV